MRGHDREAATEPAAPEPARVPPRVAAAIALGTLLNPLNSSMIAVALVVLQGDFRVSIAEASWLISGFYLAACVAQPLLGRLADRLGPRRVFCAGLVIVVLTGIGVLFAPAFGWVVAARVCQAIGSSAAFPAGLAMIRRLAGGRPPAATLGAVSAANTASSAFGPVLGGLLIAVAGWRGIFAVNIPLAAVGLLIALAWMPADARREGGRGDAAPGHRPRFDLDLPGVVLFSAVMVGLLGFLLSIGTRPNWPLLALVPVAAVLFGVREVRARTPFLDVRGLAGNGELASVLVQQVAVQCVFYTIFFGLPLWLERVRHYSAETSGVLMLPAAALGVLLTPVAARLVRRVGAGVPVLVGSVGLLLGSGLLTVVGSGTPIAGIVLVSAVLGLPNAFNNMGLQAALYEAAPAGQTGVAAGLFQTGRYVGAILSAAVLDLVLATDLSTTGLHRVAFVISAVSALPLVGAGLALRRSRARGQAAGRPAVPPSIAGPEPSTGPWFRSRR